MAPAALTPAALAAALGALARELGAVWLAGDGDGAPARRGAGRPGLRPLRAGLARRTGRARSTSCGGCAAGARPPALPPYLRLPDAEVNRRLRAGAGGRRAGSAGADRRAARSAHRRPPARAHVFVREMRPARPAPGAGDRARHLPDALVAGHVPRRAGPARLHRPRRGPRRGEVLGYLMVSQYAEVWHVLNVWCTRAAGARGSAARCWRTCSRGPRGARTAASRWRCGSRTTPAIRLYRRMGFLEHGVPAALLLGQRRGRADHVAGRTAAGRGVTAAPILAIETSCDETAAAVVEGRRDPLQRRSPPRPTLHTPYGGVVPEVAARHHLGTVNAVVDEALEAAGVSLADVRRAWPSPSARA